MFRDELNGPQLRQVAHLIKVQYRCVDQAARAHCCRLKKDQDLEMKTAPFLSLKKIQT